MLCAPRLGTEPCTYVMRYVDEEPVLNLHHLTAVVGPLLNVVAHSEQGGEDGAQDKYPVR